MNTVATQLEADAATLVIRWIEEGRSGCVASDALMYENSKNRNSIRRNIVSLILRAAKKVVTVDREVTQRALLFKSKGFLPIDSIHLALAEKAGADLITCDQRLISAWKRTRIICKIRIKVIHLLNFVAGMEE